ncbi:MAG: TolC family protein [Dysgonamonadaceae bacterium]|jgi:outer membrane protein TolC|nr:TolC family protein [Dysgonamonadaceae bacterium]
MKRIFSFWLIFVFGCSFVSAQITLESCQEKAKSHFPSIRKYNLIEQSKTYSLANAAKAWLPQVQLNARATYQSAVTEIPISLPGLDIPKLKKDQYQATLDVSQVIWDGGAIRSQQKITQAGAEVERQQLEVELYALEDRVNQLFFGILLLDEQAKQNQLLIDELQRNYNNVSSYIESGVANQAELDAVKVEQLNVKQVQAQIQSSREAFVEMLGIMTGEKLDASSVFQKPETSSAIMLDLTLINRPELKLFEAQNRMFDSQKSLIKSSYLPKLGLFVQGGYGRPGLNMLTNEFDWFAIGGIRLSWNFGALYTQKNDFHKIEINKQTVDAQRDVFLYNMNLSATRENQEVKRIQAIMRDDDEIIALRENIRKATEAKTANGAATVTDLMRDLTFENIARQTRAAHEINLLLTIYNLKNITNHE